jgi:hypothetical protein
VRTLLIEAACAYRYTPKVNGIIERRSQHIDPAIRDLAWKAQLRLTDKYRRLIARGKHKNVAVTAAAARELAAFIWEAARLLHRASHGSVRPLNEMARWRRRRDDVSWSAATVC